MLVQVCGAVVGAADVAPGEVGGHSGQGHVVLGFGADDDGFESASALDLVAVGGGGQGRGGGGGEGGEGGDSVVAGGVVPVEWR